MAQPYIGEIRMFAGNFAPLNYLFCQGQALTISQYDALYSLLGTTYGGDGVNTFNLPNLQSRVAINQGTDSQGNTYAIGNNGGVEQVILTPNQLPSHNHAMEANNNTGSATAASGRAAIFAATNAGVNVYAMGTSTAVMSPKAISFTGGNQPHSNIKPFQCINFIIAVFGVYPPRG